jgi:hypothetical protein
MNEELDELPKRSKWPVLVVIALVAAGAGAWWFTRPKVVPEAPQRFLFRKQLITWVISRARGEASAPKDLETCVAAAQPWPEVAKAIAALDPAWDDRDALKAATKELNRATHAAGLDYWVDPQFPSGKPLLTTYDVLSRAKWVGEGDAHTEAIHVRRLDTINLELGLLGHAGGDQPAILRDRIDVSVMDKLRTVDDDEGEKSNEVDLTAAKLWREQLGPLVGAEGLAEAEKRLNERETLARAMEKRLKGGRIHLARPERMVFGDAYFESLEPYTSNQRRGGPLILGSDLRALRRADQALDDSVGLRAMVQIIDLEAATVEAHEAHHALYPEEVPTPALLQSMVGASDLRFGRLSERELRAYLGQLRDAKPPACLTIIGLAKLARGRYAQTVPHFYAAHALLSVLADSDESRGLEKEQVVELMKKLCALPDAELRARADAAAETLYGAKLKLALPRP